MVVLLNAVAQFILLERGTINSGGGTNSVVGQSTTTTTTGRTRNTASEWTTMRRLLHNPDIMIVAASILVIHAVLGVMKPLSQVVLANEYEMTVFGRSLVISIATVTYMISTPLAGRYSDVLDARASMVVLGLALMSTSAVFFGLRSIFGLPALYMSVALLGSALGVSSSASQALLADLVDQQNEQGGGSGSSSSSSSSHRGEDYSMAFALSDMADSIGMIIGPVLGLAISQRFGATCGVGSIAVGCLVLLPLVAKIQ
jgi:MFS family permease